MTRPHGPVPDGFAELAARHATSVASGDQRAVLGDFRADRVAALGGSVALPADLVEGEVLHLTAEPDGSVTAVIEYRGASGETATLRSVWVHLAEGWRVQRVRNLPETPARMPEDMLGDEHDLDAPYWAGLRAGELRIQCCAACGTWIWAPRGICPECHSFDLAWRAVEPVGTVFSWTRTWQPFAPWMPGHVPFTNVVVELPAAGDRRLVGVLLDGDRADLRPGLPVVGVIEPDVPVLRWRLT